MRPISRLNMPVAWQCATTTPLMKTGLWAIRSTTIFRMEYRKLGRTGLQVSPLCIRLNALQPGAAGLCEHDALAGYYLDMDNLRTTTEQDVARLLASFWSRMQGGDEKRAALELFELDKTSTPLDLVCIKRRYRQLVSLHHPDRGGNTGRLQSINKAMEILNRYYK